MRARKYLTVGVVTLGLLASACGSSGGGDAKKDDAKGGDKKSSQSSGAVGLDGGDLRTVRGKEPDPDE